MAQWSSTTIGVVCGIVRLRQLPSGRRGDYIVVKSFISVSFDISCGYNHSAFLSAQQHFSDGDGDCRLTGVVADAGSDSLSWLGWMLPPGSGGRCRLAGVVACSLTGLVAAS
jgi:hypothetical protein